MADRSIRVECECAGSCTILGIDEWTWGDEPTERFVEVWTKGGGKSLRGRLKVALRVLLGRDHYLDALVLSDEDAARLSKFLAEGGSDE